MARFATRRGAGAASPGHGSALLYGLLHLFGYDLPEAELRGFRQLGSHTPGHPEYGETPGVECTTRFAAYGWHTEAVLDGTDIEAIDQAIIRAKADPQPSFIAVRTVIGNGAPGVERTANARAGDARSTA